MSLPIFISFILGGITGAFLVDYVVSTGCKENKEKKDKRRLACQARPINGEPGTEGLLYAEQLSRNFGIMGKQGMESLRNSLVIIIGVGGVGSHAAHMLARSGIGHLRLIDFDLVTLSSLNRAPMATRKDVGKPKVLVLKTQLQEIAPWISIDARVQMFTTENAEKLLAFEAQDFEFVFVLDCIDNVPTKVSLLKFCYDKSRHFKKLLALQTHQQGSSYHLPSKDVSSEVMQNTLKQELAAFKGFFVLSSMGAGCKLDGTKVRIADISKTKEDPLARSIRILLRKNHGIEKGIKVVYSEERPNGISLLPLPANPPIDASSKPTMDNGQHTSYSLIPEFRARVLPVLGALPAIFGINMATHVLTTVRSSLINDEDSPEEKRSGSPFVDPL